MTSSQKNPKHILQQLPALQVRARAKPPAFCCPARRRHSCWDGGACRVDRQQGAHIAADGSGRCRCFIHVGVSERTWRVYLQQQEGGIESSR